MEYKCTICGQNVGNDLVAFKEHTEDHIVEAVKADHPDWVQEDGMCKKCLDYYRNQIGGTVE